MEALPNELEVGTYRPKSLKTEDRKWVYPCPVPTAPTLYLASAPVKGGEKEEGPKQSS